MTLLLLTIKLPKFVEGSPPRYSLAPSRIMFMWLSQSIILPLYSASFFSRTETSACNFPTSRFRGFLEGSNLRLARTIHGRTLKLLDKHDGSTVNRRTEIDQ